MTRLRHPVRLRLLTALFGLLLAGPAVPGVAVEPPSVSTDGERWSAGVDRPLWEVDRTWVPGDTRSADLWLRNDSADPAVFGLALVVSGSAEDRALARALTGAVLVDGRPQELGRQPVALPVLDAGAERRVRITLALPTTAADDTQGRTVAVRLRVSTVGVPTTTNPQGEPS